MYDATPQQKDAEPRTGQMKGGHGVKRRRETSRPLEEDDDELQSIYGHLREDDMPDNRPGSRGIEARLAKLTSMIEHFSKTNQPLDPTEKQLLAQNVERAQEDKDSRQSNGHGTEKPSSDSRPGTPHRVAESSNDEFPVPSGHATDLVDPVGSLNLGHLSLEDGGKSRYVGTTYWAYISHEVCGARLQPSHI